MRELSRSNDDAFRFVPWFSMGVLLAALLVVPTARHASAHATLLAVEPADGAILTEAPREVQLRLAEEISPRFSSAQLLDANGLIIEAPDIHVTRPEPTLLVLTLPKLQRGVYSVFWKALSNADGHFTRGLVVFGVGAGTNPGTATLPTEPRPAALEVVSRSLNLGLLLAVVGATMVAGLVLDPGRPARPLVARTIQQARRRVLAWAAGCGAVGLLAGLVLLLSQAMTLAAAQPEEGASWTLALAQELIGETRWGALWLVREGLLAVMTIALFLLLRTVDALSASTARTADGNGPADAPRRLRRQPLWIAAVFLSMALVTVQAFASHAAGLADKGPIAVAADALHLLAASLWVGSLFALAVGFLPMMHRNRAELSALVRHGWGQFSRFAAIAVGALFVTGLYGLGQQVASPDALVTTLYGQALLTKIGLVLAMGIVGLLNAVLLHPDRMAAPLARLLGRPKGWTPLLPCRLPDLIRLDIGLALLVLLLTGLLTSEAPPRGFELNVASDEVRAQQSQQVDDLIVTLSVKPNRPGQNVLTILAASSRRPPPAEIMRVIARFTYRARDVGRVSARAEEVEHGRFVADGSKLTLVGPWWIDVVVRRRGLQDSIAHFDWVVAPIGSTSPTIISKTRLEAPISVAAALLFVVLAMASLADGLMRHAGRRPSVPTGDACRAAPPGARRAAGSRPPLCPADHWSTRQQRCVGEPP